MEKIGIICEYNPFHNGHLYHINKVKEMYPDSCIILALSGYFTQRGDISILSKYDKTRLALNYGVDVVIELPTLMLTNSADIFGYYAVDALNKAGVEKIVFGSETNDIESLKKLAEAFDDEETNKKIKELVKSGESYQQSLSKAINTNLKSNDILALEYIKAINKINKNITPISIQRTNDYNDLESNNEIISANNIREKINNEEDISKYIPDYKDIKINDININKYFYLLRYKILTEKDLNKYLGVDEGLDNKLKKEIFTSSNIDELLDNIKSKRYPISRLKRMLVHILLGIEKDDMKELPSSYRILGFSKKGANHLKELNSKYLVFKYENRTRIIEINASILYDDLTNSNTFKEEIKNKPMIF